MRYFGAHLSAEFSYIEPVKQAIAGGFNTIQIMFGSPQRGTLRPPSLEEVTEVTKLVTQHDLQIYVHLPYIFNTCHPQRIGWCKKAFSEFIEQSKNLMVKGVVWHPGSHKELTPEQGIDCFQSFVQYLIPKAAGEVLLLPENVAGTGTALANDLPRFMKMLAPFPKDRVKCTLDYAHSYAHGYDWNDKIKSDETIALVRDRIGLVHCNNTPVKLNSGRDIHASICDTNASITSENLRYVISKLADVPHVLERGSTAPADELEVLRNASCEST